MRLKMRSEGCATGDLVQLRTIPYNLRTSMAMTAQLMLHQVTMNRGHGVCSFTDSGSAPLHGVMTDITGSEYSGHIGFQEIGVAIDGPVVLVQAELLQVGPGYKVSGLIADNACLLSPVGVRNSPET